jgi:hypothetical protein
MVIADICVFFRSFRHIPGYPTPFAIHYSLIRLFDGLQLAIDSVGKQNILNKHSSIVTFMFHGIEDRSQSPLSHGSPDC